MAKIVPSIPGRKKKWLPIGVASALVVLLIGIVALGSMQDANRNGGRGSAEEFGVSIRNAETELERSFGIRTFLVAHACIRWEVDFDFDRMTQFAFVDDFTQCVIKYEYEAYDVVPAPSALCVEKMAEKSREQLACIIAAEKSSEAPRLEKEKRVRAERARAREAEQKAQRAKRDAEEKAIAPVIQKAIESLNPRDDTERRYAAISVSCKYTQEEAGYRVAYQAYAHASQKGVDAARRFEGGRYAICNENQVKGR